MDVSGTPADLTVFWLVVALRFLVPLLIPRFPLPAILAALILDAVDQTIFQTYTALNLDGYQGYDKALDIYYLSIAYVSTLRNWTNQFAFQVSRFLFYWRLLGVVLFELLGWRALLLFFPNAFEYFFIFYEIVRLRWDPVRLSRAAVILAAAMVWVFIKVPQEYWIHIAQYDVTDMVAAFFAGAVAGTPQATLIRLWPVELLGLIAVLLAGFLYAARRLPPADRRFSLAADAYKQPFTSEQVKYADLRWSRQILDRDLAEKAVFVTLLSIIFAQILPSVASPTWLLSAAVVVFVILNTTLSHWLARRGVRWSSTLVEFAVMMGLNTVLVIIYTLATELLYGHILFLNALFFVLLLTLIITLYDRYERRYLARFPSALAPQAAH